MIHYRLANYQDNKQLIELTAATGMDGEIALRIDRNPDFFKLLNLRGESLVFLALENDKIIGSLCASLQQLYIGGQLLPVYYIADFKISEPYRNKGIGMQLCNELANHIIPLNADLVFLNVAKGNSKPISFFKNRPGIPDFENIGNFNIHQLIGCKLKAPHQKYKIGSTTASGEIIDFLNTHYRKLELSSVITSEKLKETDIFSIRNETNILAVMVLADTMREKQNVVTKLTFKMKFLLKIINSISRITGLSKMPELNKPVSMLYIKYLAVNNYDKLLTKLMFRHARNIAYDKSYSFVSIGLHEKDPFNNLISGMFKLTFFSTGMLLSIKNNKEIIGIVKQGIPFEDYSLV